MQFEVGVTQDLFWENFNSIIAENGVSNVNFKDFIVDSARTNWIGVRVL